MNDIIITVVNKCIVASNKCNEEGEQNDKDNIAYIGITWSSNHVAKNENVDIRGNLTDSMDYRNGKNCKKHFQLKLKGTMTCN